MHGEDFGCCSSESQYGNLFSVVPTRLRGVAMVRAVLHAMYTHDTRYEVVWGAAASSHYDVTLDLLFLWVLILHVVRLEWCHTI